MDFIHDSLWSGRRYRALAVIDEWSRESLAIEVDVSLTGERVKRVLERLRLTRGLPATIRVDNVLSQKAIAATGQTSATACDASNLVVWRSAKKEKEFG
jgi:transposase InsO family protein